jgi:hypothetical protein
VCRDEQSSCEKEKKRETEMEIIILILKIVLKVAGCCGYGLCMYSLLGNRNGLRLAIYITVFIMMVIVSVII